MCTVCLNRSVKKWRFATAKCGGACIGAALNRLDVHKDHVMLRAGTVVWCRTCGAFAETRGNKLLRACLGPPPQQQYGTGGMRSQLVLLRAGLHPVTRARLPQSTWMDGTALRSVHGYARKQGGSEEVGEHFRTYAPETFQAAKEHLFGGKTAEAKMCVLRGRVKCKERRAARS